MKKWETQICVFVPNHPVAASPTIRFGINAGNRWRGVAVPERLGQNPVLPVGPVLSYLQGMSIDQIAAEALRLPPKERAMLAESLWESLTDPFKIPAESDDAEAIALALERDRQSEAGEVQPLSHEEVMSRLRR
jgi:putative addiction module component (TIGR02574 family)